MGKRTTIKIETESLLILRGHGHPKDWCPACSAESELIAMDSIGVISNLDSEAVEAWLSLGQFHRTKASDGSEFICLNSLLSRAPAKKTG